MIEPSERTLWLVVVVAAVGALGLGVPALGEAAPFIAAGILLATVADALLAGSPRGVTVRRALPPQAIEHRPAELVLELAAARPFVLDVVDTLPADALAAGQPRELHHVVVLRPGEVVAVASRVTFARRGPHALGRVALRSRGPLGLLRRRVRVRVDATVDVVPDLAHIAARAERLLRGGDDGGRRRRASEEGRELESLRDYQRGDDPRLVEWKASARRGQLVVRKLMPEARQDILVAIDVGRHLSGAHDLEDGGEARVELAVTTGLVLAAAALGRGDRAGVCAFADDVVAFERPREGRVHLRQLARALHGVEARPVESDTGAAAAFMLARQKRRAMIVFITDVLDEHSPRSLAAAAARLRGRHLVVVLALADPALARLARGAQAGSSSSEPLLIEAADRLLLQRRHGLAALEAAGAIVVDAPGPRAAAAVVEAYAAVKARGRL